MTREQYQKHKKAIQWFYEQPEGTEIWLKNQHGWMLDSTPTWDLDVTYVINDEYAEFRKAIIDDKQIQAKYKLNSCDSITFDDELPFKDYDGNFMGSISYYRIKPEDIKRD